MNLVDTVLLFAAGSSLLALLYAVGLIVWVLRLPTGNDRMREIARAIQQGAKAYLARQYATIGVVAIILAVAIYLTLGYPTDLGFLIGAVLSGSAGIIGCKKSGVAQL